MRGKAKLSLTLVNPIKCAKMIPLWLRKKEDIYESKT